MNRPGTNAFIIAAAFEKCSDFFNILDPSPLRKRDLSRDLRAYLEDCSSDILLKQDIILQFNLKMKPRMNRRRKRLGRA